VAPSAPVNRTLSLHDALPIYHKTKQYKFVRIMSYETFQTIIIIIAAISLFIYGLQNFSHEIENFGAEKLQKWIRKITAFPLGGFLLGGVVTAIIQSSTMVSSLTVSLVSSGVLSFRESLLILLGTNIG